MMHDPDQLDEFSAHLRAQPPTPLPAHWRAEILAVAGMNCPPDRSSPWHRIRKALGVWLWPHPLAYAGLTTAWALILTMRLLTTASQPTSPTKDPALAAIGAGTVPVEGTSVFASVQLANRECSWNSTIAPQP